MKKYLFVLIGLLSISQLRAQTRTSANLVLGKQSKFQSKTAAHYESNGKTIEVKAGDSVAISVRVRMEKPRRDPIWKPLTKAVVPFLVVKQFDDRSRFNAVEGANNTPSFGTGMAIVPGAITLINRRTQPKMPAVRIESYDLSGNLIARNQKLATKKSFKDWEEIRIGYKATKDGTVNLSTIAGSSMSYTLDKKIVHVTKIPVREKSEPNARAAAPGPAGTRPIDGPTTNLLDVCQAYYLVTYVDDEEVDRQFLFMSCPMDIPNGGGDGQGGGESQEGGDRGNSINPTSDCVKCKRLAKNAFDAAQVAYSAAINEYNTKRTNSESLFRATLLGCGVAGLEVFGATNTATAWAHFFPGIGTLYAESLAVFLASGSAAVCAWTAALTYENTQAELETFLANANASWTAAKRDYESALNGCGSCNF